MSTPTEWSEWTATLDQQNTDRQRATNLALQAATTRAYTHGERWANALLIIGEPVDTVKRASQLWADELNMHPSFMAGVIDTCVRHERPEAM